MRTPDLTQKVIGFRQWHVEKNEQGVPELWPVGGFSKSAWQPGPQRAYCAKTTHVGGMSIPDPCIPAVSPHCECGFYALHKLSEAHWAGDSIRGIVLGWGRMSMHNVGWRAQFVELVAMIYPEGPERYEKLKVDEIAKAYGVPTVEWGRAEAYAKEFGDYCPESLKPKAWTKAQREAHDEAEELWGQAKRAMNAAIQDKMPKTLREDEMLMERVYRLVEEAVSMVDPEIPEAYAALHNIYVPDPGEVLDGITHGITVDYLPVDEPVKGVEIDVGRNFELAISTNATVLWLPLQSPRRP